MSKTTRSKNNVNVRLGEELELMECSDVVKTTIIEGRCRMVNNGRM